MKTTLIYLFLFYACVHSSADHAISSNIQLPELGDSSSAAVSFEQERQLGTAWLSIFRNQVETIHDPLLSTYCEHLLYQLAAYSELKKTQLQLVVVNNSSINAFAVPGGVIGIHNGLFLHAETEDQFSAVLAHEIAHLSQRHYARSLEEAKKQALPTIATILAGVLLAATAGGEAGIAAISAAQAASIDSRLRFSRYHEQEADRVGMQTLVNAGRDPNAVAQMFKSMLRASRYYGNNSYEFLQTHPLTQARVSDAQNRASKYTTRPLSPLRSSKDITSNAHFNAPPELERNNRTSEEVMNAETYALMQTRVDVGFFKNAGLAVKKYRDLVKGAPTASHRYGLVLALTSASQFDEAEAKAKELVNSYPQNIIFTHALADILKERGLYESSAQLLIDALKISPDNHPLTLLLAQNYHLQGEAAKAKPLLMRQAQLRPNDPFVWYQLAEVNGLAGDIIGVHEARAEYFMLVGALDEARKQLNYALRLVKGDFHATARLEKRLSDLSALQNVFDKMR
jgi:predicted Zn-dependent protease